MIGQSIGRYHITEQLGQGGMATVYKAFDTRLECDVAVKFIRKEKLTAENAEKAFKRFTIEAKKTAQLSHPNIVAITDYGEHDSTPYLVMKYIAGNTLKQKLGQPIHWGESARILAPIARALEYAHQHKVVHRDVKPANILLTEDGEPMLSDFGIAKVLEVSEETGTLTGTGMGVGTPQYMAPEQASGKKVDHRADIYALGVVFYEMVTGNRPYDADTPLAVIIKQASDPLPPPKQFVRDLPEGVERVIFKALAKNPEDRFQSMTEFAATLEMIAQGKKIRASGKDIQRRLTIAGAIAGVVIVVVMLAFFLNDQVAQGKLSLVNISLPQLAQVGQSPTPSSTPTFDLAVAAQRIQAATQTQVQSLLLTRYSQETIIALTPTTTPTITLTPTKTLTPTLTSTAKPALNFGPTQVSDKDGMTLMYVPAGEFLMGSADSDKDAESDEKPQHKVYLDAFWIDRTEVTNAMYAMCVKAQVCLALSSASSATREIYFGGIQYNNHPVIYVTWRDADRYCSWAGRRLPSEAEWEKAARGTDGRLYPWGNTTPDNTLLNSHLTVGDTVEVGQYLSGASPYGALDMAGNVWEWVADWYNPTYYVDSPLRNPQSPLPTLAPSFRGIVSPPQYRILRGGSWNGKTYVRIADRSRPADTLYANDVGFRCAQ